MKIIDINTNGSIDFGEFLILMGYLYLIDDAFSSIDSDNNGTIDRKELLGALRDVGYDFNEKQGELLFKLADIDNNGRVSLEEFHNLSLFLRFCR